MKYSTIPPKNSKNNKINVSKISDSMAKAAAIAVRNSLYSYQLSASGDQILGDIEHIVLLLEVLLYLGDGDTAISLYSLFFRDIYAMDDGDPNDWTVIKALSKLQDLAMKYTLEYYS